MSDELRDVVTVGKWCVRKCHLSTTPWVAISPIRLAENRRFYTRYEYYLPTWRRAFDIAFDTNLRGAANAADTADGA